MLEVEVCEAEEAEDVWDPWEVLEEARKRSQHLLGPHLDNNVVE